MSEALRRLEIRLPADHWIFTVPPRERVSRIKQALDLATLINRRFDRVEELLWHGSFVGPWEAKTTKEAPKASGTFVAEILDSIADL